MIPAAVRGPIPHISPDQSASVRKDLLSRLRLRQKRPAPCKTFHLLDIRTTFEVDIASERFQSAERM